MTKCKFVGNFAFKPKLKITCQKQLLLIELHLHIKLFKPTQRRGGRALELSR